MRDSLDIALCGRVARDAELKQSKNGNAYATFSVGAVTGTDRDGKDEMTWIRVVCFGAVAERAAKEAVKGARVYVEASGHLEKWRTSDGVDRVDLKCAAWRVDLMGQIGKARPRRDQPAKPLDAAVPLNDEIGGLKCNWMI